MKNLKTSLRTLAVVFAFVLGLSAFAEAQATRTWVSGVGDDLNPCSRTAPCKTFAGAISKTSTNGEINCLDPAGYGAVTVTKSITIDCEDTQGSILASGTNGVVVNITAAADSKKAFKIRGVSINGAGTGINGIRILAANTVVVDEAIIDGFTQHGISIETTSGTPKISVDASGIRSNSGNGINSFVSGGSVTLAVSNSRLNNNATGVNLSNNTNATVFSSTVSGNTTGLLAFNATLGVIGSNISHNTTGITASTSGTVRISGNQITNNGTGLSVSGGSLISYSSNMLDGNTVDGSPTSTILLQ